MLWLVPALLALAALFAVRWKDSAGPAAKPPAQVISLSPTEAPRPAARVAETLLPAATVAKAPPLERPRVEAGPPGGAIEGRVLSAHSGRPIENAELTFQRDDGASSVRTAADGAYAFAPGAPGRYRLAAVSAEGYLPFAPAWGHSPLAVALTAGQRVRGVDVRLAPAIEYLCTVLTADGKPAAGAELRVLGAASGEFALLPLAERATANQLGEARLRAPDDAVLEARREGSAPGRAVVDLAAQLAHKAVVRLGRGVAARAGSSRISGTVVDDKEAPVAGALVEARHRWERGALHAPAEAVSGPDGAFALAGLDEGDWSLQARGGDLARAHAEVPAGKSDVVLRLRAGGVLRGRVTSAGSGAPVPGFTVLVWRPRGPLISALDTSRAFVDASGAFELAGLEPGAASASVAAPGFAASAEEPVTIGDEPASIAVTLAPGPRLAGAVLQRGTMKPIEGARVAVEGRSADAASPALQIAAVSDEAGLFSLSGLPRFPFSLSVNAAGHHARIVSVGQPPPGAAEPPPLRVLLTPLTPGEEPGFELAGIGAALSADGKTLLVRNALPGGGAAEAGLLPGDHIIAIDGRPIIDLGFEGSMNAIRGPEGTSVLLTVTRGGAAPAPLLAWRRLVRG